MAYELAEIKSELAEVLETTWCVAERMPTVPKPRPAIARGARTNEYTCTICSFFSNVFALRLRFLYAIGRGWVEARNWILVAG